jgi:hypothetical protein
MPMEPNRTRQIIQDLARAFNKLASELTADLSYAAREIESLRKEVQKPRSTTGKSGTNGGAKKSAHSNKNRTSRQSTTHTGTSHTSTTAHEAPKPAHEPDSFVFPQEPFSPTTPPESTHTGNN